MKKVCFFIFLISNFLFCERSIYVVRKAKGKIKIDGVIGKEEWKGATIIKKFYRSGDLNKKVHSKTTVYILYDNEYLYIAGKMDDKDIFADVKEKDGPVWYNDVFEVFIKPKFSSPHYYEINTNPLGTLFDAFYPRRKAGFSRATKYSSGTKVAAKVYGTINKWEDVDSGWTVEEAIPFTAFSQTTHHPEPGDIWYFSICRYDYSVYLERGVELTSSAKFHRINFHLYENYDKLIFK